MILQLLLADSNTKVDDPTNLPPDNDQSTELPDPGQFNDYVLPHLIPGTGTGSDVNQSALANPSEYMVVCDSVYGIMATFQQIAAVKLKTPLIYLQILTAVKLKTPLICLTQALLIRKETEIIC